MDMHTSQGRAKGLRMNSTQGLTYFLEDIGMASPFLPCVLKDSFAELDKPRNHKGVMTSRNSVSALKALLNICYALSTSAHSRLMSLLITLYFHSDQQARLDERVSGPV